MHDSLQYKYTLHVLMVVYADIPMMLIASLYLVDQKIIPFFEVFNSLDRCSVCQIVCFLI